MGYIVSYIAKPRGTYKNVQINNEYSPYNPQRLCTTKHQHKFIVKQANKRNSSVRPHVLSQKSIKKLPKSSFVIPFDVYVKQYNTHAYI